jgi:hypothetical protein
VSEAEPLLEGVAAKAVAADKAYDSQSLVDTITASGAQAVIPRVPTERSRAPTTGTFTRDATLLSASSAVSNTSAESQHDTISWTVAMRLSLPSLRRGSGSLNVNTT